MPEPGTPSAGKSAGWMVCEWAVLFWLRPNGLSTASWIASSLALPGSTAFMSKSYQIPTPSPPAAELPLRMLFGSVIQNSDGIWSDARSGLVPAGT